MKKYALLLQDKALTRWYDNLGRGSPITANNYLRKLGNFCATNGITPQLLLRLSSKKAYELLLDNVSAMERRGAAGGQIASVLKAVKSWLAFNGRPVSGQIRIKGADETPTLRGERVPTQQELRNILLAGDEKSRVICVVLAHAGVRPQVLGNFNGSDGLTIRDIPELQIRNGEVTFTTIPAMVIVRSSLSKTGKDYFTFLSEEGCQYLGAYMEQRARLGEKLTQDSPLVIPKVGDKGFISTPNVGEAARKAIRKAGFPWRPYVLRSYFDTQMMLGESKGLIIRDYRTFFMGHKGDIEHTYTLNKRRLPDDVIDQMRQSYAKAQKYLQTTEIEQREDMTRAFKRQLLLVAGFKTNELKDEHLDLSDEEFQKLVRERLVSEVKNNGARQKVVDVSQVEGHLAEGWEYVGALPNNKAIVKLPQLS